MPISISFHALRALKDQLPDGSMGRIAQFMGISEDSVRNYFGGNHFQSEMMGIHYSPGPDGGWVTIEDETIYHLALEIVAGKW
jgi:hypothetical protein